MLKLFVILFTVLTISFGNVHSQDTLTHSRSPKAQSNPNAFTWDKVSIGGNLGFSRYYLNISPLAGYMLTPKLMAGVGATYISFGSPGYPQWLTIYGGKVFGRYYFIPQAFAHAELEELNGPWDPMDPQPFWINTTLVGGGYRQHIGGSLNLDMMLLFNINEHVYTPYRNPILRMGVNIGL